MPLVPNRRMFPSDLISFVKRGLPLRGDIEFRQDGSLTVMVWQDTKTVVMSTAHSAATTTTVRRKKGDGSITDVTAPKAIVDYNMHMGGVDRGGSV